MIGPSGGKKKVWKKLDTFGCEKVCDQGQEKPTKRVREK